MNRPSTVAVVRSDNRRGAVAQALALVADDLRAVVTPEVLIKANLVSHRRQLPSTHADTLSAAVDAVIAAGARRVVVAEGASDASAGFDRFGFREEMLGLPVEFFDINREESEWEPLGLSSLEGTPLSARVSRTVASAPCRVSLALMKTHVTSMVTFSLKNMLSSIHPSDRIMMHGSAGGGNGYRGWKRLVVEFLKGDSTLVNALTRAMGRARNLRSALSGKNRADAWQRLKPSELGFLRSVEAMNRNLVALSPGREASRQRRRRLPRHAPRRAPARDADPARHGRRRDRRGGGRRRLGRDHGVRPDRDRVPPLRPKGRPRGDRPGRDPRRRRPDRGGPPPVRAALEPSDPAPLGLARLPRIRPPRPALPDDGGRPPMNRAAIIVATTDDCPDLDARLARFAGEAGPGGEVILVDATARGVGRRDVRALRRPAGTLVPLLWRDGLRATDAPLVAFTTTAMTPRPGWIAALRAKLETSDASGVGGPIEPAEGLSTTDRAVALLRYSGYFPPLPGPARVDPPGENALYRRDRLAEVESSWADGFWEVAVHRALRDLGHSLAIAESAVVRFEGGTVLADMLRRRFAHARNYGESRSAGLGPRARLARAVMGPAVPPLLAARALLALRARRIATLPWLSCLPAFLAMASAWAAGEVAGTCRGGRLLMPLVRTSDHANLRPCKERS